VLVKAKVDVNLRDKKTGQTALDIAIEHEREDTGYILLKLGAKVNKRKYPSDWIKPEKKWAVLNSNLKGMNNTDELSN